MNIIGIASAMCILLLISSVFYMDYARRELAMDLLAKTELFAANIVPMLAFQDQDQAYKLAETFRTMGNLMRVMVFDQNNAVFADLITDHERCTTTHLDTFVTNSQIPGTQVEDQCLYAFAPVFFQQERVGTVVLESTLLAIRTKLIWFVFIGAAAAVLGIFLSATILRKLQQMVLTPIIDMSKLAEKVATNKSYHLRAKVDGSDEVAKLAGRLNFMLDTIEEWDKKLNDELYRTKASERHLDNLAKTDALTGFPNRLAFMEAIEISIDDARKSGETVALMFLDLDDFKKVNDEYGHHYGDMVLKRTSKRLQSFHRDIDELYRLGGDEFALLLRSVDNDEDALAISRRMIEGVSQPIIISGEEGNISVKIGLSIGIAFSAQHGQTSDEWLHRADIAMYAAKQAGKNRVRIFEEKMENVQVSEGRSYS